MSGYDDEVWRDGAMSQNLGCPQKMACPAALRLHWHSCCCLRRLLLWYDFFSFFRLVLIIVFVKLSGSIVWTTDGIVFNDLYHGWIVHFPVLYITLVVVIIVIKRFVCIYIYVYGLSRIVNDGKIYNTVSSTCIIMCVYISARSFGRHHTEIVVGWMRSLLSCQVFSGHRAWREGDALVGGI